MKIMKKLILLLITLPFFIFSCTHKTDKSSSSMKLTVLTNVRATLGDQKFIEIETPVGAVAKEKVKRVIKKIKINALYFN